MSLECSSDIIVPYLTGLLSEQTGFISRENPDLQQEILFCGLHNSFKSLLNLFMSLQKKV